MHLFSCLDKSYQNVNSAWLFQLFSSSINITRQAVYVHANIKAHSCKLFCRGKALSTTYYEWVSVAFVIQHAKRARRIIYSAVVCPVLPCFSTLSHKRHDFRGKKVMYIKCVFWSSLQLLLENFLILRDILYVHVQYLVFLSDFNETWIFSTDFRKILKYKI